MVFFILSGLVIYHSTSKRRTSLGQYAVARATRIYSVALPVIFQRLQKPIVILASYTFTLFLIHAPVMKTIHHNFAINPQSPFSSAFVLLAVFIATYAIGQLTEKRRQHFAPAFSAVANFAESCLNRTPRLLTWIKPNRQLEDK